MLTSSTFLSNKKVNWMSLSSIYNDCSCRLGWFVQIAAWLKMNDGRSKLLDCMKKANDRENYGHYMPKTDHGVLHLPFNFDFLILI